MRTDGAARALTVYGDANLVSQVYQNLLVNAFKYARRGQVILDARDEAGTVTCTVQDTGEGIAPEMLARANKLIK